jgi:hypothetical protein
MIERLRRFCGLDFVFGMPVALASGDYSSICRRILKNRRIGPIRACGLDQKRDEPPARPVPTKKPQVQEPCGFYW